MLLYLVDCVWNDWNDWGPCSASCLGGIQLRSRSNNPSKYGGENCNGTATESRICNNDTCKFLIDDMVWGIIVGDSTNWSLNKMSKCCCDSSSDFSVRYCTSELSQCTDISKLFLS